jgi:protein-ribulosamine 3-kinase
MKENVLSILSEVFSQTISIKSSQHASGGNINQAQILLLSNEERVFLKSNTCAPEGFFVCEAKGLNILEQAGSGIKIPKVLALDPSPNPQFIILECLGEATPGPKYINKFGRFLAALHKNTQDKFGLDHNNFIGSTVQINTPETKGILFFTEHRIRFQQTLARNAGRLPKKLDLKLDQFCDKLDSTLNLDSESPALLHGDLWSGNHFPTQGDVPCIFDPAVYYGPREADLAMMELFGSMPQAFYSAYSEVFPLDPGYQERRKIFNLYHLLNHLNLFGDSYLGSVETTVNTFTQ